MVMAMNKKSRRRLVAMQRILIAGILLFSVSLSVILMFRDRLSLLLVSNVQTELLDITRQNSMYVDSKIAGIFSSIFAVLGANSFCAIVSPTLWMALLYAMRSLE